MLAELVYDRMGMSSHHADCLGDLIITFHGGAESIKGRTSSSEYDVMENEAAWKLLAQPTSDGWKGFPIKTISDDYWRLWLLGEIYGHSKQSDSLPHLLLKIVKGQKSAGDLNGHYLLFAWNGESRQWHLWTDRFGTLHAYYATDGRLAAIGTFSPAVAAAVSRRQLDWLGLTGFFAFGFFPQDRTYFDDVKILRPASHYVFDENGQSLGQERYWQWWHEPDRLRSYDDTVAEFADILCQVIADQMCDGRIALPISGGLDSRSTVAALNGPSQYLAAHDHLWSYSYGYSEDSAETSIARRVAEKRNLPFQSFTIKPYLFERLEQVLACVEGFQDITQCRQAAVVDEISPRADVLIAAHWGDVWLDDLGLVNRNEQDADSNQVVNRALEKIVKGGSAWLLEHLCLPRTDDPEGQLREIVRDEVLKVGHIEDQDFRLKAFKTDQWSFRWTIASLRMFQPAAFPRLPFYDTRLADFFCTVPSEFLRQRRLQIDYLRRFSPDLARITWQAYDTNLFWQQHFNSWLLPKRILKKARRIMTRPQTMARNWEVQFLNDRGRDELEQWLLRPGLKLHEFVPVPALFTLLDAFYAAPLRQKRGYTVSMLLTFSAWLEMYG